MKINNLIDMLNGGINPIIQFTNEIEESVDDMTPDPLMRGKLLKIAEADPKEYESEDENISFYEFKVDLSEYEEHNKSVAKRNFYDKDGKATQTWFDSGFYPKEGIFEWVEEIKHDEVPFLTIIENDTPYDVIEMLLDMLEDEHMDMRSVATNLIQEKYPDVYKNMK